MLAFATYTARSVRAPIHLLDHGGAELRSQLDRNAEGMDRLAGCAEHGNHHGAGGHVVERQDVPDIRRATKYVVICRESLLLATHEQL